MRALLRNVYEDKNDFWHGGVPYNCAVSIIEVQNGVSTLLVGIIKSIMIRRTA